MDMKYVIFTGPAMPETPFIFPASFSHHDMVEMMRRLYPGVKHISAAKCQFDHGKFLCCYGKSLSLQENNIAREIDTFIIQTLLEG